jgi:hypothetical protein
MLAPETSHDWLDLLLPLFFVVNTADNLRRLLFAVKLASKIPTKNTNGIHNKVVKFSEKETAKYV